MPRHFPAERNTQQNAAVNRWTLIVPKIKKVFFKFGVRYYKTDDGKIWDANVFDSKLVAPKTKVLPARPEFVTKGRGGRG